MKRQLLTLFLLGLIFSITLSACGGESQPASSDTNPSVESSDEVKEDEEAVEELTPEEEIIAFIHLHTQYANDQDIDKYMSTIHSESPYFAESYEQMEVVFDTYELEFIVDEVTVIEINGEEATVEVVQTTKKISGPEFHDNQSVMVNYLKKEDGLWKFLETEITDVIYLDEVEG